MDTKNKRGRRATVSISEIAESMDLLLFDENVMLKKERHPSWKLVLEKINFPQNKINLHNLYMRARANRHAIYEQLTGKDIVKNRSNLEKSFEKKEENDSANVIINLKNDVYLDPLINEVGSSPFFVIYRWPEQTTFWKAYSESLDSILIIDVIELKLQVISKWNPVSDEIFLYNLMSKINNDPVPLFQVLAETNSTDFLKYIMCEWLREKVSLPKKIYLNSISKNLFNAATIVFNNMSIFVEYNVNCFLFLQGQNSSLPQCTIEANITYLLQFLHDANYLHDYNQ